MALTNLRQILVSSESTFADSTSTSFATHIPVLEATATLNQERGDDGSAQSRKNQTRPGYMGIRSGSLELKVYLCGHNTAPTGALTATWLYTLLSDGLGGGDATGVGAVCSGGTSTTTALTFSGGTATQGSLMRVGVKGDTRADGQAYAVNGGGSGSATGFVALPAAPSNGDQVYPMLVVYPNDTGPTGSKRFCVMHAPTGAQFQLYGCVMESVSFDFPIGGLPTATLRYQAAYWTRQAISFPSSTTLENCNVAPIAAGSLNMNAFGTTTRSAISPTRISLTLDMGLAPKPVLSTAAQYQAIGGYERTKCIPDLEVTLPWENTFESFWDTDGSATTTRHFLATLSTVPGSAIAFYMPRAYPIGQRPSYVMDEQGVAQVTFKYRGQESTNTNSELVRSPIRIGLG